MHTWKAQMRKHDSYKKSIFAKLDSLYETVEKTFVSQTQVVLDKALEY